MIFSTYARWLEKTGRTFFAVLCTMVIVTSISCLAMLFRSTDSVLPGEHAIYAVNLFLSPILFFVAPIFALSRTKFHVKIANYSWSMFILPMLTFLILRKVFLSSSTPVNAVAFTTAGIAFPVTGLLFLGLSGILPRDQRETVPAFSVASFLFLYIPLSIILPLFLIGALPTWAMVVSITGPSLFVIMLLVVLSYHLFADAETRSQWCQIFTWGVSDVPWVDLTVHLSHLGFLLLMVSIVIVGVEGTLHGQWGVGVVITMFILG